MEYFLTCVYLCIIDCCLMLSLFRGLYSSLLGKGSPLLKEQTGGTDWSETPRSTHKVSQMVVLLHKEAEASRLASPIKSCENS